MDIKVLLDEHPAKLFSHYVSHLLTLLIAPFAAPKLSKFNSVPVVTFHLSLSGLISPVHTVITSARSEALPVRFSPVASTLVSFPFLLLCIYVMY